MQSTARRAALSTALSVGLLLLWQAAVTAHIADPFYFSSPVAIIGKLGTWLTDLSILNDILVTGGEIVCGFLLSALFGVAAALLVLRFPLLREALYPLLNILNAVPRIALAPLFILWFGIGMFSKLMLIFSIVGLIFFFNVSEALRQVDGRHVFFVRMLGGGQRDVWRHVHLPAVANAMVSSIRLGVAYSVIGAVVGEMIASRGGLGHRIAEAEGNLDSTGMLAALAVLCLLALVLDFAARTLHHYLLPWQRKQQPMSPS